MLDFFFLFGVYLLLAQLKRSLKNLSPIWFPSMNSYIVDINEKLLNKTILIFSVNSVKFNLAVNGGDYNSTVKSSIFAI